MVDQGTDEFVPHRVKNLRLLASVEFPEVAKNDWATSERILRDLVAAQAVGKVDVRTVFRYLSGDRCHISTARRIVTALNEVLKKCRYTFAPEILDLECDAFKRLVNENIGVSSGNDSQEDYKHINQIPAIAGFYKHSSYNAITSKYAVYIKGENGTPVHRMSLVIESNDNGITTVLLTDANKVEWTGGARLGAKMLVIFLQKAKDEGQGAVCSIVFQPRVDDFAEMAGIMTLPYRHGLKSCRVIAVPWQEGWNPCALPADDSAAVKYLPILNDDKQADPSGVITADIYQWME